MKRVVLFVSLVALLAVLVGCNALQKAINQLSGNSLPDLSGSWEIVATSTSNPGVVSYVEFNGAQQGNGNINAAAQEFILSNGAASALGNCLGVVPGNPQGNITATVATDNIQGTFTETSPSQGSASFSINAPLSGNTSFSGNYAPVGDVPAACSDMGTYVATMTSPLNGTYSGTLTYPDGTQEMMNLTATQDSAYNLTVTGNASGGSKDGAISLSGTVTGNLAQLSGTTSASSRPVTVFAWWNAVKQRLYVMDNNNYSYGSLARQ